MRELLGVSMRQMSLCLLALAVLFSGACGHDEVAQPLDVEGQAEDAAIVLEPEAEDTSDVPLTGAEPEDVESERERLRPEPDASSPSVTEGEDASDAMGDAERSVDTLTESVDVSQTSLGELESAWGVISGECGALSSALESEVAQLLQTEYSFNDAANFDSTNLSPQALKRYEEPNAGGSSRCSEVMSMQLLIDCAGASILKTETEMVYAFEGKIADYLAEIAGVRTGVSVTRAYKGPVVDVYSQEDARELLEKKLNALVEARANVAQDDQWEVSLLHIWTLHPSWALTIASAWEALDPATKGDHLVLVTTELGSDYIVSDSCDD